MILAPNLIEPGPVRLRRNGRQRRAVGLYFSVKNGRHLPFESRLELHDLWRAEVDCEVVRSFVQPFTLELVGGGERWRYTPDRRDLLADGRERIVEVKDDGWVTVDPVLASRLAYAEDELNRRGLGFEVRTRSVIQAEPSFSAVNAVQLHRRTAVCAADEVRVREIVDGGPTTLGRLQDALGGGPAVLATLCALMVRRVIAIDLSAGLHDDALVRAMS